MEHFVLDLDPAGKNRKLRNRGRLLEINAIVDRDPRLELRQPNERVPGIAAEALQLAHAPRGGALRPGLEPVKNETRQQRQNEKD
jgi:hypothetical protein